MTSLYNRERFEADLELSQQSIGTDKYLWTRSSSSRSKTNAEDFDSSSQDRGKDETDTKESHLATKPKQSSSSNDSVDLQDVVYRLDELQQLVQKLSR